MDPLRRLIYRLKRLVHRHPRLYRVVYFVTTLNADYLKQKLASKHYSSRFGGLWTDRKDFERIIAGKAGAGEINEQTAGQLRQWRRDGYAIMRNAIGQSVIDTLLLELDRVTATPRKELFVTGPGFQDPRPFEPEVLGPHRSIRVVDFYFFSETARDLLLDSQVMDFLRLLFEEEPLLTQSLSFHYGSEQPVHQDTAYVITNSPYKMIGVWFALEDVVPGSGELVYYPGSHRWPDYLFSGYFKHFDSERDGPQQQAQWSAWIHAEAQRRDVALERFLPRKGDLIIWHAGLAHGGAPIEQPAQTRRSLVGHYCPRGVRPLYHYYKPRQRKFYRHGAYQYSSAYYRR